MCIFANTKDGIPRNCKFEVRNTQRTLSYNNHFEACSLNSKSIKKSSSKEDLNVLIQAVKLEKRLMDLCMFFMSMCVIIQIVNKNKSKIFSQ